MASVNSVPWTWPAEVLEFARKEGIEEYLDPLLEAARRMYPLATRHEIRLEREYDYPFGTYVAWDILTPKLDTPTYRAGVRAWRDEQWRIVPAEKAGLFHFTIVPVLE